MWYSIQAVRNDSTAEVLRQAVFRFGAANAAMKKLKKCLTNGTRCGNLFKLSQDGGPPEGVKQKELQEVAKTSKKLKKVLDKRLNVW